MKPSLYLIDGTALLYRSHFAFIKNPLVNSKGQVTSAIFGVVNYFLHLLEKKQATHILISFDRKAPTFRHEISDAYKANRPPMPDDLISQIEPVKQFFNLIGMPEISLDGYEADDVLATIAERYKQQFDVVMVTSDKDYSQLVDDAVSIYDPAKDTSMDRSGVFAKFGVYPEQFVDYLALVGDSSDNIPGVRGIGPKGAENLLTAYQDLDGVYAHLSEIKDSIRIKLEQDRENAYLSRQLAQIIRDVPIEVPDPHALAFDPAQLANAIDFLGELEINYLKRRIENKYGTPSPETPVTPAPEEETQADIFAQDNPASPPAEPAEPATPPFEPVLVNNANLDELLQLLHSADTVSIDTETDALDPMQAALVGISLCMEPSRAWYLPIGHQMHENLPLQATLKSLCQTLQGKLLVGHNLKYDLTILRRHGWNIDNPIFDTMLAAYIIDPGKNQYSLDACAEADLQHKMIPITALIGSKAATQISFDLVDVRQACEYAAEDAWAAFMLHPIYQKRLEFTGLSPLYEQIELPLVRVLQRMEETGVTLDTQVLSEISHSINIELKTVTDAIYAYAGYQFNINSTQQLAKLLFEENKLPARKKTKSGYSTDNSVLEDLADDYEITAQLIQYRQLTKLESTYVSTLPKLINPHTGRIHSSFNQTVASTGRLSSSNPNLQNIPIRTELGRQIRKAFKAPNRDWVIMAADYSQIELRLLALLSRDAELVSAFRGGSDIHRQMAATISGKDPLEVSPEERRRAKVINFGLLYGMGQKKLSRELGITLDNAKEMIKQYFDRFPSIRAYISSSVDEARRERYCQTLFGRKLYLPNINSGNQGLKSEAERVAVNMPIQGTAADLIKIAMRDIHALINTDDSIRMILQVHDELVFEVRRDHLDYAKSLVRNAMENALPEQYRTIVELKTDIGVGENWFEAH